jgi:D-alanyl-lipoteichoic acid acyltransferase DltB (MBOAT superfamily)
LFQAALYIVVFLIELVVMWNVRSVRVRQAALLLGSYVVYLSWTRWFLAVLLASTVMNYLLGEWVRRRPYWPALTSGIGLNLVLLSSFKYLPAVVIHLPFASAGYIVLDFSGDEPLVRSIPWRRLRPFHP